MNHKKYIKHGIIAISIFIILNILAALLVTYFLGARITYANNSQIGAERELLMQQGAQPVRFTTQDNAVIAGLLLKRPRAQRIFVIVHGFKHTKEKMRDFITLFPDDTLLFIDLRGQGESSGTRLSLGLNEHLDVIAAVEYLKNNFYPRIPIIGIGISQGGSATLRAAAAGAPFNAVIADSAPSEFKEVITTVLRRALRIPVYISKLALWFYQCAMGTSLSISNYENYSASIACPVLIFHDQNDHLINYAHAENLYQGLTCKHKKICPIIGTRHGKMHQQIPHQYKKEIESFLSLIGEK